MSTDQTAVGYIVLDTNVFCADMHGRGTSTAVLIQGIERLHYSLLVPEIVRDETMMKHRQAFTDAAETYEKSVIALRRFLPPWPKLEFPTITPETSFQRFNEQFPYGIDKSRVKFLPYPSTAPSLLLTVLDPVRIKCFENLGSLNSEYFLRNLESLDNLRAAIEAGEETRFNVLDWIRTELIDLLQRDDWGPAILGVDFLSAYPSKCEEPSKVQIDDVRFLPSGDVLLSFSTRLEIEVSVSFDGSDYDAHYDEMSELMGEPDGPVSDATAWVSFESYVAVSLVLEKETLRMISSEVDELEGRHGLYEANQHPVS